MRRLHHGKDGNDRTTPAAAAPAANMSLRASLTHSGISSFNTVISWVHSGIYSLHRLLRLALQPSQLEMKNSEKIELIIIILITKN